MQRKKVAKETIIEIDSKKRWREEIRCAGAGAREGFV